MLIKSVIVLWTKDEDTAESLVEDFHEIGASSGDYVAYRTSVEEVDHPEDDPDYEESVGALL